MNMERLKKVQTCINIPINDTESEEDLNWLEKFKKTLKNYKCNVEYKQKGGHGRYFGNGMQGCPREVRKYLSDDNYIDIDIVNCHPVLLENIMKANNIQVPEFLLNYNKNRSEVMKEYSIKDKLYLIKLINNEICYDKRVDIIAFHKVLYTDVITIFKLRYPQIKEKKEKNELGSFMAKCLQHIENDILMCMYNKCLELKMNVGVLCFDGMMIEKNTYFEESLKLLEEEIYLKLNYNVRITEKSMETDWEPLEDKKQREMLLVREMDNMAEEYSIKHLELIKNTKTKIEAMSIMDKAMETTHNMLCKDCNKAELYGSCSKEGYQLQCKNCDYRYPDNRISIDKSVCPTIYNSLTVNVYEDINTKDTLQVARRIDEYTDGSLLYTGADWYFYNTDNGLYEKKKEVQVIQILNEIVDTLRQNGEDEKWLGWMNKISYKENLMRELKSTCYKDVDFDEDGYLLGFENGVFDLRTDEFRKGKREEYVTMKCGVEFSMEYDTTLADEFLKGIFQQDDERIYALNSLCLSLEGFNRYQTITFDYGYLASNGKSYLMDRMKCTLKDYSGTFPVNMLTSKMKSAGDANTALMAFYKKRHMYCSEPEAGSKINVNIMKLITGDPFEARELFKGNVTINPTFDVRLCCNVLPNLDTYDRGAARRIRVQEYNTEFVLNPKKKYQRKLKKYSKEEEHEIHCGLLKILIETYSKLRKNDYIYEEPKTFIEMRKMYLNDNKDVIENILTDNFEVGSQTDYVKMKDVKNRLKQADIKDKDVITIKKIVEGLFDGIEYKHDGSISGERVSRVFVGLKMKDD